MSEHKQSNQSNIQVLRGKETRAGGVDGMWEREREKQEGMGKRDGRKGRERSRRGWGRGMVGMSLEEKK